MAGGVTPSPTQTSRVSPRAMAIPSGLVPAALLLAAAVGLLALLPSLAQAVWEVPHLVLLGLVISYGVLTQRNADAGGNGNNAAKEGSVAWNARYHPDGPLVVVADHASPSPRVVGGGAQQGARESPLSLPVRRLKTAPSSAKESETDGDGGDALGEETDSCASSSGFWAGARAVPSPPSVLDADMGLSSPCSQPQSSRPFFTHSADTSHGLNAATPSAVSRGFVPGHRPPVPRDQPWSDDDGEATDWDDEDDADVSDGMAVSSERSVRGYFAAACTNDYHSEAGDGDTSVDEELVELAAKAAPDGEEEVDRKADEFIAKFREQIRLQRH